MRRCQAEIDDRMNEKKRRDSDGSTVIDATTFDDLLARHGAAWRTMSDADSMRCVVSRARRMLKPTDFDRLALWVILERGVAFARGAGLLTPGARLEYAS